MDDRNLYAPPVSDVTPVAGPVGRTNEFFVVSPRKFCLLYFGTFGLYQLYWFYMHWARYRRAHSVALSPVTRTLFAVFYTHSLTKRIDASLRASGRIFAWTPAFPATVYVIAQVVGLVVDLAAQSRVAASAINLFDVLILLPLGWALLKIQCAANAACADPQGESNQLLTPANYLWLVLGGVLWLLTLTTMAGVFMADYVGELRP